MGLAPRLLFGVLCFSAPWYVHADLPVHCLPEDVFGDWDFVTDGAPFSELSTCGHGAPNTVTSMLALVGDAARERTLGQAARQKFTVTLTNLVESSGPAGSQRLLALGPNGMKGSWTVVFDEGFEVRFGSTSYATKFEFEVLPGRSGQNGDFLDKIGKFYGRTDGHSWNSFKNPVYGCHCDRASVGWHSRDMGGGRFQHGCFYATRRPQPLPALLASVNRHSQFLPAKAIKKVAMPLFTAFVRVSGSRKDVVRLDGGNSSASSQAFRHQSLSKSLLVTSNTTHTEAALPQDWDWRDQHNLEQAGDDLAHEFDQGACGSCYAFAAVKSLTMRFRIGIAKRTGKPTGLELSWRSTARCSPYSEGCNGGWSFLIGRLAKEVGIYQKTTSVANPKCNADAQELTNNVGEQCNAGCSVNPDTAAQPVWFAKDYGYVGGYAQGSSEIAIMREIYERGPVCFELSVRSLPSFVYGNSGDPIIDFDKSEVLTDSVAATSSGHAGVPQPHGSNWTASDAGISPSVASFHEWLWADHVIIGVGWGLEHPGSSHMLSTLSTHPRVPGKLDAAGKVQGTPRYRFATAPTPYWTIRNSWGKDWGSGGYSKLLRGTNAGGVEISVTWIEPDFSRMPAEIPPPK